ncbi:bab47929-61ff-4ac5-be38-8341d381e113 [Sclerotinia trifoliorum]|uniref:Bab47929-61ff-4ac5-be38-8341d381e113 n=1 Tax=Sclerotinia trifoliorum TaxID=28548 RepID=A0A8H2VNW7_9HELO|nr:bab47929-61ff-4ac5-be38-8341d381e113 [Sclerotinia trifoliorum]
MDSNPWSMPWPREPPVVVRNLQKLPIELVHEIMNDLPVIKILSILSWESPYLDQCVITHIRYKQVFTSHNEISRVVKYYTLYREICWFHRWPSAEASSVLALSYYMLIKNMLPLGLIFTSMSRKIRAGLYINPHDLDLLLKHGGSIRPLIEDTGMQSQGQPLNLKECWIYWNWIKESKLRLNKLKSQELRLAARLVEQYPRILKKPHDPSQGAARPNTTHLMVTFERLAVKALCDRNLSHYWNYYQYRSETELMQLVPYDRYLWLLLETLAKHPLDFEVTSLEESLARVSLLNQEQGTHSGDTEISIASKNNSVVFQYPENIAKNLRTVLKGLMYIYTEPSLTVPRIQLGPTENASSSEKWPKFFVHKGQEEHAQTRHIRMNWNIRPHDERECEWLVAFLGAVTWIELNVGPAKEDF